MVDAVVLLPKGVASVVDVVDDDDDDALFNSSYSCCLILLINEIKFPCIVPNLPTSF